MKIDSPYFFHEISPDGFDAIGNLNVKTHIYKKVGSAKPGETPKT